MDFVRDYGQDKELVKQFLKDFTYVDEDGEPISKYGQMITRLANRADILMTIDLKDLEQFNHELAKQVYNNTLRYQQIFYEALDELLPQHKTGEASTKDIMDVFIEQRLFIAERNLQGAQQSSATNERSSSQTGQSMPTRDIDIDGKYPPDLIRRAETAFKPASLQPIPIREVRAEHIGKLVTVRGIVTRTTDVKPKITIVCYTCDQCGCETFQPVKGQEYTPLFQCSSGACKANKTLGRLTIQQRGSKFVKFQEIKLQEHSDQVPTGHIPRTVTIMAHGEQTRKCTPGDHVSVSGVFLTVDKNSYRLRTGGLSADTYIEAHYITLMNKTEDDELNVSPLSEDDAAELVGSGPGFLDRLSRSIAPEIWGHNELKQALLLLLVGGVDRSPHGMRIRGNINICLMGDPGVAKSQLLSFIDRLAPRSQYTTGRGSSGVGLTAAVLKDAITGELALEGGALVLADEGICCIDEFDKMMDADRTAIHEVMEQQTVSIAKAGIMTTLNARVSILAAANPAYGRYNVDKSITDNLQLPPALLSRFDLLWLIKDNPNKQKDLNLAQHITNIHSNPNQAQVVDEDVIDMKTMRRYISLCKTKNPVVPEDLDDRLVRIYLELRSRRRLGASVDSLFTSPRSLLAVLRMATAFARLRLADVVNESDIVKACHLYNSSRESIESQSGKFSTVPALIMDLLRELVSETDQSCDLFKLEERAEKHGLFKEDVSEALEELKKIGSVAVEGREILLTQ